RLPRTFLPDGRSNKPFSYKAQLCFTLGSGFVPQRERFLSCLFRAPPSRALTHHRGPAAAAHPTDPGHAGPAPRARAGEGSMASANIGTIRRSPSPRASRRGRRPQRGDLAGDARDVAQVAAAASAEDVEPGQAAQQLGVERRQFARVASVELFGLVELGVAE